MAGSIFSSINPASTSGNQLATILNDFKDAVASGFSGTSRPANLQAGGYWVDTTVAGVMTLKLWTGTVDATVYTLDTATGVVSFSGTSGTFQITKQSADAVGPILQLIKKRIAGNGQTLIADSLGDVNFYSTDNSGNQILSAKITSVASNNATATESGAYIVFHGTAFNSPSLTEQMRLKDGKLGIGTTSPDYGVHVKNNSGLGVENESDTTTAASAYFRKKRISGLGQVLSADEVMSVKAKSTDDTGAEIDEVASLVVTASENHTAAAQGVKVELKTKDTGSATATTKVKIESGVLEFPTGAKSKHVVVGSHATASTNVKVARSATGKASVVLGDDATAEGSEPSVLAQLAHRMENFTTAGKPANNAANVGRIIFVSDTSKFEYDNGTSWVGIGGGQLAISTQSLDGSSAVAFSGTTSRRLVKVTSTSGEVNMSGLNPQIQAGVEEGQELILVGQSDADYIILKDNNGLSLAGDWYGYNNRSLTLVWIGSTWVEISRR